MPVLQFNEKRAHAKEAEPVKVQINSYLSSAGVHAALMRFRTCCLRLPIYKGEEKIIISDHRCQGVGGPFFAIGFSYPAHKFLYRQRF